MTDAELSIVRHDDWSVLHALAQHVRCAEGSPVRHASHDLRREVERSARRLSRYIAEGALVIRIHVPGVHVGPEVEAMVSLEFDDGLEPIVVPWSELDLSIAPVRRRADAPDRMTARTDSSDDRMIG